MSNGNWNFNVEKIELDDLDIDANVELGMVIVQSFYELNSDGEVNFRISEAFRESQKNLIEKAFQIRNAESEERGLPIPFILFPEYAIPFQEPDGLHFLQQQLEQAEGEILFIGGLEGLNRQEIQRVLEEYPPNSDVARPIFTAGSFVNVCVIVVKSSNGRISWHFQAKLQPSESEQGRNMANGQRVLYFITDDIAFICQICFDHIASHGAESLNTILCRKMIEKTKPAPVPLDFVFVPQYNKNPLHKSFKENTGALLNIRERLFNYPSMAVVAVNKASREQASEEFGRSGFYYRTNRWRVPVSDIGPKGYELSESSTCTSAVFRKRTQAIHVASLVPPLQNIGIPGNLRKPLNTPRSYLISEECDPTPCSCLPGTECPVGRYVECECLPCKLRDIVHASLPVDDTRNRWQGSNTEQSEILKQHYREIRENLLKLNCARAHELIQLLLTMYDPIEKNPDLWSSLDLQWESIIEMIADLCVLAEFQQVNFRCGLQWTAMLGESIAVALIDGKDDRILCGNMESEYRDKYGDRPETRTKPILLVAMRSEGYIQPLVKNSTIDITEPNTQDGLDDDESFVTPAPLKLYVCQDSFFRAARQAEVINDFLSDEMRCALE